MHQALVGSAIQAVALGVAAFLALVILEPERVVYDRRISMTFMAIVGFLVALAVFA
jgi:hypothetical protein